MSAPVLPPFRFTLLTLFPESLQGILGSSLIGKAIEAGRLRVDCVQIRDYATDKHRTVDDTPYGGGEGMILRVDVLHAAWKAVIERAEAEGLTRAETRTILLSPQGALLDTSGIQRLACGPYRHLVLICGHYEGVDERIIDLVVDEELSIGDYVLTGGELPALVVVDALARQIPGVVGKAASVSNDSLEGGVLKYPQYTRPRAYKGREVPEILLSGDHGAIAKWRTGESTTRTAVKRPDLARLNALRVAPKTQK